MIKQWRLLWEYRMDIYKKEVCGFYYFMNFGILPLIIHQGFSDIIRIKVTVFYWIMAVFSAAMAVAVAMELRRIRGGLSARKEMYGQLNLTDLSVIAFAFLSLLSCMISEWHRKALLGSPAYFVGGIMIACLTVSYLFLSRNADLEGGCWYYLYAGGLLTAGTGLLNRLGCDPLGMYREGMKGAFWEYLSTIGQMDFYYGFLSILICFFAAYRCGEQKGWRRAALDLFLLVGYSNAWLASANAIYAGLGAGFLMILYTGLRRWERLKNLFIQGILISISGALVRLLRLGFSSGYKQLETIPSFCLRNWIFLMTGAICGLILYGMSRAEQSGSLRQLEVRLRRISRWYGIGIVLLMLAMAVLVFLSPENSFWNRRPAIWRKAWTTWWKGGICQKIFGYGPGCLDPAMRKWGLLLAGEKRAQTAHNEILDYLVTTGILGALSFVLFLGSMLHLSVTWEKEGEQTPYSRERVCLMAAIAAYLGQGIGNGSTPVSFVIIFGLAALYRRCELKVSLGTVGK